MILDFSIMLPYAQFLLSGLIVTLKLTVVAFICSFFLSIILAWLKLSRYKTVRMLMTFYTSVFRGIPLLVQIMMTYFAIPQLIGHNLSPWFAASVTLALNSSAFMSESIRGGIMAVDYGQREAAMALGISNVRIMLEIVFPQALRSVMPALANETITLLKSTSLASCISLVDLLRSANLITSKEYRAFEPLLTVAAIYYILVMILSFFSKRIEHSISRSGVR